MNNKILIVAFMLLIGNHTFLFSQNCIKTLQETDTFVKSVDQYGDFRIETYYLNGKKHCTERWYVDNELFIEKEHLNGKREGKLIIYNKGKIETKGQYVNDKAEGLWIYYNTMLNWKYKTRFYDEGELVETKYYLFGLPILKLKRKKEINKAATKSHTIIPYKVTDYQYRLDTSINVFKPDSVLSELNPLFVEQIPYNIEGDSIEIFGVVYSNVPVENVSIYEVLDINDNMYELVAYRGKSDAKGEYSFKKPLFSKKTFLFIKDGFAIYVILPGEKD